MEFIVITIISLISIIILAYIFNYNIKKIKQIGEDKKLDELSKNIHQT